MPHPSLADFRQTPPQVRHLRTSHPPIAVENVGIVDARDKEIHPAIPVEISCGRASRHQQPLLFGLIGRLSLLVSYPRLRRDLRKDLPRQYGRSEEIKSKM